MAKRIVWTDQAKTDVRGIEQPIALQILKTLARYAQSGEGNTKQLRDIEPPLIRLRAQHHRIFSGTRASIWKSPACWIGRRLTDEVLSGAFHQRDSVTFRRPRTPRGWIRPLTLATPCGHQCHVNAEV
jgi:hypothetical protein